LYSASVSETVDLLLRGARLPDRQSLVDIAITGDRIVAMDPVARPARQTLDLGGRLVTPGLVEAHIHLDKALLTDRVSASEGTLEEAIRVTGQAKRSFTAEDITARARKVLDLAVRAGTTAMRSHVEVDPIVGLTGIEAMLELRREYAPALDLQLCAFPQEGILKAPGTDAMMRQAMEKGADVVGAIPYNDRDAREHVDWVFRLAREFDRDLDFHQDFRDDADAMSIEYVARKAIAERYEGRVSVGHLTALGAAPPARRAEIVALLRDAGISVICLPATDLHLGGRKDESNVRRALTPVRALRDGGVNVCLATNNIRNAFTPFGNGDLLQIAALALPACHLGGADDQPTVLPMLTTAPAKALRLPSYGLEVGKDADLVLLDTRRVADAILDLPDRSFVVKRGRIVARTERRVELSF
jgi:cytosine deaminase